MPQDVRIWEIRNGSNLRELKQSTLDLEEKLEDWMEADISILRDDLMVIGRQVDTAFGGIIDLLCLDSRGDLVVVELKRDKTPREITTQMLDYASWVKDLSHEKISEIANDYLGANGPLEDVFKRHFDDEIPETLNEQHEMLAVASNIDSDSERIINYLSDEHGVPVNAVTFHYYKDKQDNEFVARVFLIEPSEVEYRTQTKSSSKRKPNLSYTELQEIAEQKGVGKLYSHLFDGLSSLFDGKRSTRSSIGFTGKLDESNNVMVNLLPPESDDAYGLKFQIYIPRITEYLGINKQIVTSWLPEKREEWRYHSSAPQDMSGYEGFFKDMKEVNTFLKGIEEAKDR